VIQLGAVAHADEIARYPPIAEAFITTRAVACGLPRFGAMTALGYHPPSQSALESAERRFRDLVHEVDGIVWELEPATQRFTFVNRRAEELLAYPIERWLAAQDFRATLIDPRDREHAQTAYDEATRGHRVVEHEFRATAADGRVVWLRDRVHRAESGRLRGLMVDITEQKRLEQERAELLLREQEARAEVEAAVDMVQRLQAITEAALAPRSLDQLLRGVVERIHDVVEADTTVILLPTEDGTHLTVAHAIGLADGAGRDVRVPIGEGLTGRIAASGQPLIVDDAGDIDLEPLRDARVKSLVGVPLSVDGDLVAVVQAARHRRRSFSADEARLLQLVGDRVSTAIRNARLLEEAQRARRVTEGVRQRSVFLADATTALFAARDPVSALSTVARLAVPAVADWCVVDLHDRDGGYRRVALAHSDSAIERGAAGLLGTLTAAPPADSAVGRALHSRAPQWRASGATAADLEARGGAEERAQLGQLGVASYVCAPLLARRRTLGAITFVAMDAERSFGPDDVALVCELARRAAVAIDDRRRRRETRELLRLFARLVSGALELEREPLELRTVVEAAGSAVVEEARAKNVAVDVAVDAPDTRVRGDRRRLRQVLQRIIEGALRVAPTGGRVVVQLACDGAVATVAVSAAGASGAPATGMRLSIVRRLLELHGGSVATSRGDDRGPTLTVSLPLIG
jgi:PAS domain S-box-containing protein